MATLCLHGLELHHEYPVHWLIMPVNTTSTANASRKRLGHFGERLALQLLTARGYRLVAQNWRAGRLGELDMVVLSSDEPAILAFVEVKTRRNNRFGEVVEALGIRQQTRLSALAEAFLQAHPQYADYAQRFDLFCLSPSENPQEGWHWQHLTDVL